MRTRTARMTLLIFLVSVPVLFLVLAQISLKKFEGLRRGDQIPLAVLHTVDDVPVETASWLGAPILLVVIQPGCQACRNEIDTLAAIAPSFPELHIVLLSTETDIEEMTAPFPVYIDHDGNFLKQVRKLITPAIYWMDASGRVRYARAGQHSKDEEKSLFRMLSEETEESNALNESRHRTP
jgi:hypothetical protein